MASILCHTNVSEVVSKYPPKPVSNLQLTPGKLSISLTWEDPEDYTEEGYTCAWAKTVVVRKTEGYPNDVHDGTIVVTTIERNKYKSDPYIDGNLTAGTTYYYRVFSCSTDGVYGTPAEGLSVPIQYKVMTVKLNLANSNPESIGSYANDATSMTAGKNVQAWADFFGYKPCLFKDGKVVGYLNPNDFTKFENGSVADITSGNTGDVMIEFPRRGISISKSGNIVSISMTDNPSDSSFKYYAHQRGSTDKDYFYLGAYLGYVTGNKLKSLSGKTPSTNNGLSVYDEYAKTCGNGYSCFGFYQLLFIQVMFVLQYKGNLNSQSVHGLGYYGGCAYSSRNTGNTNSNGMMFGDVSNPGYAIKIFGIEDLWGNIYQLINNFYCGSSYRIYTTTDDSITDVNKYTDISGNSYIGQYWSSKYYTMCLGTTEAGFVVDPYRSSEGSSTTYFCDTSTLSTSCIPFFGGYFNRNYTSGIFNFICGTQRDVADRGNNIGTRLQYL